MKFLVVEGTVREGRKSIHAARHVTELLNNEHDAEIFDPAEKDIPLLKNTSYGSGEIPEDVEEYKQKVEEADCIVIVTPEYNHSIPGALKNLIDHLYPEYEGKPFASITVSGGGFGGVRAQMHLNEVLLEIKGIPGPSLPVSRIGNVFSDDGELIDDDYRRRFKDFADDVVDHAQKY